MGQQALRNVAALANSEGGVIYVGAADDGTVYSLEPKRFSEAYVVKV
ncbi:MAG: ATP-binding protein [Candidatus Methanoplasma sp.]|jgi:hypothetical protein|nr:ATP-binding protein [Candidatus Methanoplasma sp.]